MILTSILLICDIDTGCVKSTGDVTTVGDRTGLITVTVVDENRLRDAIKMRPW